MEYIEHFKIKIQKNDKNRLTRNNYCIPTTKLNYSVRKNIQIAKEIEQNNLKKTEFIPDKYYFDIPNEKYADEENYTVEWMNKHYKDCMQNFDLNMKYFEKLNYDEFNNYLSKFIKKNRFIELFDLNEVKEVNGIYILVLDNYKQVYIGISSDIKKRILNHWRNRKDFDRLIYGCVDDSIISVDSFGALDTTRIFYKKISWTSNINELEEKYVKGFDSKYLLNRVAGGINGEEQKQIRNLILIGSRSKRNFSEEK